MSEGRTVLRPTAALQPYAHLRGSRHPKAAAPAAGRLHPCQHQYLLMWRRRKAASQAELRRPLARIACAGDGRWWLHQRSSGAQGSEMCRVDAL